MSPEQQAEVRATLRIANDLLHLYFRRSQLDRDRLLGLANEWERLVARGAGAEAQGVRTTWENAAGFYRDGRWYGLAEFLSASSDVQRLTPMIHS
jgi:hypothetical protein